MQDKPQAYAPGLYGVIGEAVNAYVLDSAESGLTVIDTGLPGSAKRILGLVEQLGRTPQDVKQILITHTDVDHVGGLKGLVRATGAAVYASADEAKYLKRRRNPPHVKPPMSVIGGLITFLLRPAVAVDHVVQDGEVLEIAGGIRAILTPGHTPDHVAYYWERERVLFAGDLLNNREGLVLTPPRITWDQSAARQSAKTVLALDPAVICVGHGPVWLAQKDPDRIKTLSARLQE